MRPATAVIFGTIVVIAVAGGIVPHAQAELLEFDDSTSHMIAATHIASNNTTGWNDPTIYTGDFLSYRYHVLIAIKDTVQLRTLFNEYILDSAALSIVVANVVGTPGSLDVHVIRRDSTGIGVYPAYDDSRSYYCRSEWYGRKNALPYACPDSILWESPGASGSSDVHPIPFASVATPQVGQRYDIDVTPWIDGIVTGIDSVSNGIVLLSSTEDGSGTDFLTIRHIHPFYTGVDRMILKLWRSPPGVDHPARAWLDSPSQLK